MFVAFTAEGVHPRQKMLYASARDDVRRALGAERFQVGDYYVSEAAELSAAAYASWRRRDAGEAMSSRERMVADVNRQVNAERASAPVRSVASMQKVPVTLAAELSSALEAWRSSSSACASSAAAAAAGLGWLEIRVDAAPAAAGGAPSPGGAPPAGELLQLCASGPQRSAAELLARIGEPGSAEPRFWLTAPEVSPAAEAAAAAAAAASAAASGGAEEGAAASASATSLPLLLIYHCPELAKPKTRMLYSTAKTALTTALASAGVLVAKTVRSLCCLLGQGRWAKCRAPLSHLCVLSLPPTCLLLPPPPSLHPNPAVRDS
jgi:hypothetical protein